MGFTLIAKGITIGVVSGIHNAWKVALPLATMFLPGLLLALLSLCHYKTSFKDILSHPSLLLLPVFSHFTFSFRPMCCSSKEEQGRVQWSRRCTPANIVLSIIGICLYVTGHYLLTNRTGTLHNLEFFYFYCLPVPIMGMILTLIFCYLDICCSCCCSCSPDIQGVLQPQEL